MLKGKKKQTFFSLHSEGTRVEWWVEVRTSVCMSAEINAVLHVQRPLSIFPILTGTEIS